MLVIIKLKKGNAMLSTYSLSGATLVTPERIIRDGRVKIEKNRIKSLTDASKVDIELEPGSYCYPALINVHDHLRGNYLPRIGPSNGDYYLNWSYWERDLRSSPVLEELKEQPPHTRRLMLPS